MPDVCPRRFPMQPPPFAYRAYGLTVHADLALPGLRPGAPGAPADLVVAAGPVEGPTGFAGTRTVLRPPSGGALAVEHGRTITLDEEGGHAAYLRIAAVTMGLATALHQRGALVLHAGAVVVAGGAVAFVGHRGAGKSTTTTAMARAGHPLVTDDVLVVPDVAAPVVAPGYAAVKLCDDAAAALFGAADALPELYAGAGKRSWAPAAAPAAPVPLRAVYVLGFGDALQAERLGARDAVLSLLPHVYTSLIDRATGGLPAQLGLCAGLAGRVPVFALERPRDLAGLGAFTDFIAAHAAALEG